MLIVRLNFRWITGKSVHQSICKTNTSLQKWEMSYLVSSAAQSTFRRRWWLFGAIHRMDEANWTVCFVYLPSTILQLQRMCWKLTWSCKEQNGDKYPQSKGKTEIVVSDEMPCCQADCWSHSTAWKMCQHSRRHIWRGSKKEATVILLRYVEVDEEGSPRPLERLADVFTCGNSSREQLYRELTQSLKAVNVDMQFLVGQGYDGNVRGKC